MADDVLAILLSWCGAGARGMCPFCLAFKYDGFAGRWSALEIKVGLPDGMATQAELLIRFTD
jgi:hypothetical protein